MFKSLSALFKHRKKNIETKLIWFISLFIIIVFVIIVTIYYKTMLSVYSEQLLKSNESVLDQIVIAFESVTKQTMDSIYKIPLYDKELLTLIRGYSGDVPYKMDVITKLNSIILGNEYMSSACLYIPKQDIIFDADSGTSSSLETFFDKSALENLGKGKIYVIDPRMIETHMQKKLLMTVVCPIPIPATSNGYEGALIVYIDAQKLYYNILKKIKVRDNIDFYAYNIENIIILHKDENQLNKKVVPQSQGLGINTRMLISGGLFMKKTTISSIRFSKQLNWNFFLKTDFDSPVNQILKLYSYAVYFLVIMLLSLPIIVLIVKFSVKPIKKAMTNYNDKLWKDFITNDYVDSDEIKKLLSYENFDENDQYCAVTVFQFSKLDIEEKSIKQHVLDCIHNYFSTVNSINDTKPIIINKKYIAVVIYFKKDSTVQNSELKLVNIAARLHDSLNPDFKRTVCLAVSLPKESLNLLGLAYMECMESLNYRICINSSILRYSSIKEKRKWYEYPYDIERQLVNNIIVGNIESCRILSERFLESLIRADSRIQDSEYKNCIYQLQAAILKNVTNLPISNTIDYFIMEIMDLFEFGQIKCKMLEMIEKIVREINKKDENDEYILFNRVLEYVDKNYNKEDFNLNKAADELKLNRNYLAKILKEKTSEHFNDYINSKRIMEAKRLLTETDESVEDISRSIGFNYSHYFIKVFKGMEGITPGQYREKINRK